MVSYPTFISPSPDPNRLVRLVKQMVSYAAFIFPSADPNLASRLRSVWRCQAGKSTQTDKKQ
jgi:hypothetical protein